jgi:hypothetical protein
MLLVELKSLHDVLDVHNNCTKGYQQLHAKPQIPTLHYQKTPWWDRKSIVSKVACCTLVAKVEVDKAIAMDKDMVEAHIGLMTRTIVTQDL